MDFRIDERTNVEEKRNKAEDDPYNQIEHLEEKFDVMAKTIMSMSKMQSYNMRLMTIMMDPINKAKP